MPRVKVTATIEVTFEVTNLAAAKVALSPIASSNPPARGDPRPSHTAPAEKESQRDLAANLQQLGRPNLWRAGAAADLTVRAATGAAEPRLRKVVPVQAIVAVDRLPARRITARAVDVQLEAVARDVADRGDG
jgi:hypothetical protein